MKDKKYTSTDILVLCGGLGTRLRPVLSDTPKVLAPVGDKTFLDILSQQLSEAGFRRVILCTGYLSEQIEGYIEKNNLRENHSLEFVISREDRPLGTGGAVKLAEEKIKSDDAILINGDTLLDIDYEGIYDFHKLRDSVFTIGVVEKEGEDFGNVLLGDNQRIVGFQEKGKADGTKYVSAGVYVIHKSILSKMPSGVFSLEVDVIPKILEAPCHAMIMDGDFLDIGTPDRYKDAQNYERDK